MIIDIYENTLSSQFCNHCIWKFERDERKEQGLIGGGEVRTDIKDSIDLSISSCSDWQKEDKVFYNTLKQYTEEHTAKHPLPSQNFESYFDTGYQIQRTDPGGFYNWHQDWSQKTDLGSRVLTYIWYLNDINHGGFTEFLDGTRITPKQGNLLIFPATWNYFHRGVPPEKETKYIVTGWMYNPNFNDKNKS